MRGCSSQNSFSSLDIEGTLTRTEVARAEARMERIAGLDIKQNQLA